MLFIYYWSHHVIYMTLATKFISDTDFCFNHLSCVLRSFVGVYNGYRAFWKKDTIRETNLCSRALRKNDGRVLENISTNEYAPLVNMRMLGISKEFWICFVYENIVYNTTSTVANFTWCSILRNTPHFDHFKIIEIKRIGQIKDIEF